MAEGLLIIRLVIGGLLFAHGSQKLFGWFGGYGLDGTGGFFESLGFRPGRRMAGIAGLSEAGGGALLVLGLLTPLGAAMVIGTMIAAAVSVHAPHGLWSTNGGYELPLINALVATGLAFTGGGRFSIDHAAGGIPWTSGPGPGLSAIVLALLAFGATNLRRRRVIDAPAAATYPAEAAPAGDPTVGDETAANESTGGVRR
jgi:putative oxidoreductase